MQKYLFGILVAMFLCVSSDAFATESSCAEDFPFKSPVLAVKAHTTMICHKGYLALVDDDLLVPRWVAYDLTGPHTFGCLQRVNDFHPDESLDSTRRAKPSDYSRSGYDKGHQAPAQDFAWDSDEMHDSFSMANMAPQLPGLNRKEWERLEEDVRVWAYDRGDLFVYVGPVFDSDEGTIGPDHVSVPVAFWKIVVDPEKREALAFMMPNKDIAKGPVDPWESSIQKVEAATGLRFSVPSGVSKLSLPATWPADLTAWHAQHKAACSG